MKNYLVTFKNGIGDSIQSIDILADKVYVSEDAATFYRGGSVVASFATYLRFIVQETSAA